MKRNNSPEPERQLSPSFQGRGARKSASLESVLEPESPPLSSHTELVPAGEIRDLVLEFLVEKVLEAAIEAQKENKETLAQKKQPKDYHAWAATLPTVASGSRPGWCLNQTEQLKFAAMAELSAGSLLLSRGSVAQYQEAHDFQNGTVVNQRLQEVRGASTWVEAALWDLVKFVPRYADESDWKALASRWPRDLDLSSLWLAGCSDLSGDQLLILQGDRAKILAASKGLVPARTIRQGRESLIVVNSLMQKLEPLEAALIIPGAIRADCLLWLE